MRRLPGHTHTMAVRWGHDPGNVSTVTNLKRQFDQN